MPQPDVDLEAFEARPNEPETLQYRALWRAVIAQLLRDLALAGSLTGGRRQVKLQAALWFGVKWADGVTRIYGTADYREVCDHAGIGWKELRDRVEEIMQMDLSDLAKGVALNELAFQIQQGPLSERSSEMDREED